MKRFTIGLIRERGRKKRPIAFFMGENVGTWNSRNFVSITFNGFIIVN